MSKKKEKLSSDGICKKIEICSMRFTIKPPGGDTSTIPEMSEGDLKTGIKIPSFNIIGQDFITVLQMLWKYMHSIGAVAQKTSITNLASLPIILEEVAEREKNAKKGETPIAVVEFNITIRDENKNEESKEIYTKVYERRHLKSLDEFRQYNDAALKILNESALQQIVNAYEKVICELLTWHFHNNPDAAPKDKEIRCFRDFSGWHGAISPEGGGIRFLTHALLVG